jgi:ATP-dependent Clp protease protease subunit
MENSGTEANINIYGDITSYPWMEGDTSAVNLSQQLDALSDVSKINVFINSYGGEVAEGLAIYNALKRHKAKVVTVCDGFACSIASVIFMAGDERIMNESSLLMIHNAWSWGEGNADQLRKMADDLDKSTEASITAYKAHSNLSEEEIKALLDAETWLLPSEALEYGFATSVEKTESKNASQSVRGNLFALVKKHCQVVEDDPDDEDD